MDKSRTNIILLEPSDMIFEGLVTLIMKSGRQLSFVRMKDPEDIHTLNNRKGKSIAIVNPSLIKNKTQSFSKLKSAFPQIRWIALIYSYFDPEELKMFDEIIHINDPGNRILSKISDVFIDNESPQLDGSNLSERELEVLRELIGGLSNKEIADKLNISTHTVISHRKNIVEKTGIKSLPGLTIFALSKRMIDLDS